MPKRMVFEVIDKQASKQEAGRQAGKIGKCAHSLGRLLAYLLTIEEVNVSAGE